MPYTYSTSARQHTLWISQIRTVSAGNQLELHTPLGKSTSADWRDKHLTIRVRSQNMPMPFGPPDSSTMGCGGMTNGVERERPPAGSSAIEYSRRLADKFPAVCMALKGRGPAAIEPRSDEEETQRQVERLSACPFNRSWRAFGGALEQGHVQCRLGGPICSYSRLVNKLERDIQAEQHAYVSALGEYLTKVDESEKETKNQLEAATRVNEQVTTFRAAREYFRTIENLNIRLQAQKTVEHLWSAHKPITFDDNRLEVAWRRASDTLCNKLGRHWYEPEGLS